MNKAKTNFRCFEIQEKFMLKPQIISAKSFKIKIILINKIFLVYPGKTLTF